MAGRLDGKAAIVTGSGQTPGDTIGNGRATAILNVSSIASICSVGLLAYKTSKAGVNALTHSLAIGNAEYGIRVNAILPGLMNTPMAIETITQERKLPKEAVIRARDAQV